MTQNITIYEPNQRKNIGFFKLYLVMFKNIIKSRGLMWQLFRRDFLMSYKKSFLGISWIFISPIIGIISWVFMSFTGILNHGDIGIPYPAYVLISSSIWGLFMGFYEAASGTLNAGSGFILQVKYPHEALLVKQTFQHLANFFLGFLINIIVIIAFGVIPSWKIIFFPLAILPLFLLGAGIGLIVSVINIVAFDFSKVFNIFFGLLFFITPVIYSDKLENNLLQKIIKYNPLTYLIGNVRDMIIYGRFDNVKYFLYSSLFALLIFLLSWRLFYISEEKVIEKMI